MKVSHFSYSKAAEKEMERLNAQYTATLNEDDTEYQLAVHGISRLVNTSLLTDKEREVLRLYYGDGMLQRDIATALGVAPSVVNRHIKRANALIAEIYTAIFPRFAGGCKTGKIDRKIFGKKPQLTFDRVSTGVGA